VKRLRLFKDTLRAIGRTESPFAPSQSMKHGTWHSVVAAISRDTPPFRPKSSSAVSVPSDAVQSDMGSRATATSGVGRRRLSRAPRISVVIPAHNEARNIGYVLRAMPEIVDEIVLADSHSVDETAQVAMTIRPDIKIVRPIRRGVGAALAAGFESASGDYVVMMEADGSTDPMEILALVAALDAGADYVIGSRFMVGGGSADISRSMRIGGWVLGKVANLLFRTRFSDLRSCYNAFRRECLDVFALQPAGFDGVRRWGDGFEIFTALMLRAARARLVMAEVPSFERSRMYGMSNVRALRDLALGFRSIVHERFSQPLPLNPQGLRTQPASAGKEVKRVII
jgi:hypothetical protein